MLPLILFLVLSVASIVWALHTKIRRQMLRPQGDRKQLSQMMTHHYGVHFPEYLNNRRLAYAQQLMLTTQMKMTQVAEESGFAGSSHMNRLFKQQFDCTPTAWLNFLLSVQEKSAKYL